MGDLNLSKTSGSIVKHGRVIDDKSRVGKDLSTKSPERTYPYLLKLVKFLEQELPDVEHYYKGGFFIGNYTKEPRHTQDIDMSILKLSQYDRVKTALAKLGDELIASGDIVRYVVKDSASEQNSGGAKYYAQDGSILFSTDIGFQEVPCHTITVDVDNIGNVQVSSVEQMLSDKLCALFSRQRFHRSKDIYDTWHLITTCDVDMQQLLLLLDKHGRYPLHCEDSPFAEENIDRMEDAYRRLRIFRVEDNSRIQVPEFGDIQHQLNRFWWGLTDAEV